MSPVHVAVAVITNARGEVLIARRPDHVHQGGLWEFPGGKVEPGETVVHALNRELREELGITAERASPLIRVAHAYPDKSVLLDVWRVASIHGEPHGREGQPVRWVAPEWLLDIAFPAANAPIVTAVRLPPLLLVTGEPERGRQDFLARIEHALRAGIRLVQLRAKTVRAAEYDALARDAIALCRSHRAELLLNAAPHCVETLGGDGVHLTSERLLELQQRPLPKSMWVSASCHSAAELEHAQAIGVDFAMVSPVLATATHPGATPLGWDRFERLTSRARIPIYALGGMTPEHVAEAMKRGGQGIAARGAIWDAVDIGDTVAEFIRAQATSWIAV